MALHSRPTLTWQSHPPGRLAKVSNAHPRFTFERAFFFLITDVFPLSARVPASFPDRTLETSTTRQLPGQRHLCQVENAAEREFVSSSWQGRRAPSAKHGAAHRPLDRDGKHAPPTSFNHVVYQPPLIF